PPLPERVRCRPRYEGHPSKTRVSRAEKIALTIYQAWRVISLAHRPRVLEIGAGLGRTAFYLFGVAEYVAIDIPLSNVAQAHFLSRTIGEDVVRILHQLVGDFDVALNVDALTEMARPTATEYLRFVEARYRIFLSINHEANLFTGRDLYADNKSVTVERHPSWMRRGYVEEVIRFRPAEGSSGEKRPA
ncbi:SAM-dependent methyltransferase, partial [Bradyrhizobium sp. JR4.1]